MRGQYIGFIGRHFMSKSHIYVLLHLGLFRNFCEHILKYNAEFNDLQEKESNVCV